ncbi:MAG: hypothetical protein KKA64_02300 [Nanoarchaeota archaeon]|nr:hypothetical protein [Nanoarchaeota archaeon]
MEKPIIGGKYISSLIECAEKYQSREYNICGNEGYACYSCLKKLEEVYIKIKLEGEHRFHFDCIGDLEKEANKLKRLSQEEKIMLSRTIQ